MRSSITDTVLSVNSIDYPSFGKSFIHIINYRYVEWKGGDHIDYVFNNITGPYGGRVRN
jgi:hypothetical protein